MYNTSVSYKDKIQSLTRVFTLDIIVEYKDKSGIKRTIKLDDTDISNGSFTHEEASQSSDEFTVGGVYGSNITFTIINDDKFENIDFIDAKIIPTVGLLLGNNIVQYETWMDLNGYTWQSMTSRAWGELTKEIEDDKDVLEFVPLGVFNVDTVDEHRTTTEIRAIDDMIKLDKSYSLSTQSYPTTLKQIFLNICNVGGVTYRTLNFPNSDYIVDERPEGDYSLRDILGFVAELSGTFAQFNREGSLELKWYDSNSVTITPDNRSNFVAKKYKVQITGISKTIKGDGDENDTVYLAGNEGYVIDLSENPLLQDNFESILQIVYNKIKHTSFTPYEATWQGNPAIQAGDKVTHVSVGRELEDGIIEDGEVFETIITNSTFVYRGAGELSARGLPEISRDYSGSNLSKIRRQINVEIGREVSRLDAEREKAGQLIANMMGGHLIVEYDALYISNTPELEDATKVWKWGLGGFGYFPKGLYDENGNVNDPLTGVTAEGSIVAELIAAGIVSADYVETGILSSFDGENWINLDNNHFKLGGLIQDDNGFRIEYGGTNLDEELNDIKDSIKDNVPTYTWIKYSNEADGGNVDGSDMSDDGMGMSYIGIASNKGNPIPSIDPSEYMWSRFKGEDGDGKGIASVTQWYLATDLDTGINNQTTGWSTDISGYNEVNKYLWNYEEIVFTKGLPQITNARLIGVWGKDGVGVKSITEYYLASPLSSNITNKSHGFSTTPQPINETNPYLWNYEKIIYTEGEPHLTEAVIIGVFGKDGRDGEDGYIGEDALVGVLTSDTHTFPVDGNGNVLNYSGAESVFRIYRGLMDDTSNWRIRVATSNNIEGSLVGNKYIISKLTGNTGEVKFIGSRDRFPDVEKTFKVTTSSAGVDASSYWIILDSNILKEDSLGRYSPPTITGRAMTQKGQGEAVPYEGRFAVIDGTGSSYFHYRSQVNESEFTFTPNAGLDSLEVLLFKENTNIGVGFRRYVIDSESVVVLRDGSKGEDGEDGKDAIPERVWIRYSQNVNGINMTTDPTDAKYIGLATGVVAPEYYYQYDWSKFVAEDGVRGPKGEDGVRTYLHIRYSNNGRTFTNNNGRDQGDWIGQQTTTSSTGSTTFSDYTWWKIKGEKGDSAISVYEVDVEYRLSDSNTRLSGPYSWKTTLSSSDFAQGKFIWSRTVTYYSLDGVVLTGNETYSSSSLISGNSGADGSSGRGITRVQEEYYLSVDPVVPRGDSWRTVPKQWKPGSYMFTRSRIYYSDGTSNTTPEVIDRAWEKINGIDRDLEQVILDVNEQENLIKLKVSKGELTSEFLMTPKGTKIESKNIDLVGSVTVLDSLVKTVDGKKDLGTITAGRINGLSLSGNIITGGTINIGPGASNEPDAFRVTSTGWLYAGRDGFRVPANADGIYNIFSDEYGANAARWKFNDRNYIRQDFGSIVGVIAGSEAFKVNRVSESGGTHTMITLRNQQGRGGMFKALGSSSAQIQIRNTADNAYIPIGAADFNVGSNRSLKKDVSLAKDKLNLVKNTSVYNFKFKEDKEENIKTGFIYEESPNEISTDLGDEGGAISLMNSIAVLWKAVQELSAEVDELKKTNIVDVK